MENAVNLRMPLPIEETAVSYPISWRLCFHWLPRSLLALLVCLIVGMSVPVRAANELSANNVLEHLQETPGAGQFFIMGAQGGYLRALAQHSRAHFRISGLVAQVELEQTFVNQTGDWVNGVYVFPLPDDAAVNRMEMQVGERLVLGEIREREEARQVYRDAARAGKKASLLEQQRPNLFSNRLANIGPGETITVRLRYVQRVAWRSGEFSLRFPTTVTARYIPGVMQEAPQHQALTADTALGWARPTDQVPDADAITPPQHASSGPNGRPNNPIEITAELVVGMPLAHIDAAYHDLAISRAQGGYAIALKPGVAEMNRDFVLSWQPVASARPTAAWFAEEVDGQHYGMLMVVPPAGTRPGTAPALPREMIFVIDTSGSMGGLSIAQAREALAQALDALGPNDRFNVISFSDQPRRLFSGPMPATRHFVEQALAYVSQLRASGGTEMLSALELATEGSHSELDDHWVRQIVFITDGAVGNEQALFEAISQRLGEGRLFTVGIGSAPNSWFMRKAAQFGRGTFTAIGDIAEVQTKMAALFRTIAAPLVTDITLRWPAGAHVETYPERVPDLYAGEPLILSASFGATPPVGPLEVDGLSAAAPWSRRIELPGATEVNHPGIGSVWARRKIEHLLDTRTTGADEDAVRTQVLDVALPHALVSPYTSFVAVEQIVSRPGNVDAKLRPVPNSPPQGQSAQTFVYPAGATDAPARLLLGSLCLFLAMMAYVMRREEVDYVPARA